MKVITSAFLYIIAFSSFSQATLKAGDVVERIKKEVGIEWGDETVDTYKSGDPNIKITGIATTFLANLDVLKRAKASGLNMVITHEPTFYNHFDHLEPWQDDPVQQEKLKFLKENNMVVWRFHDYWHRMAPDGIYKGVIDKMNWGEYAKNGSDRLFEIPEASLMNLAKDLKQIFGTETIRVVGDSTANFSKVGWVLGAAGSNAQIKMLQRNDVEAIIIGETHEWETVEYVRDAISQGRKKALIIIGHANSEEAGMAYCADWLKTFINEVPIEFIPAGDPFWGP